MSAVCLPALQLIIEEADIATSRDCPLELEVSQQSMSNCHRPGEHSMFKFAHL